MYRQINESERLKHNYIDVHIIERHRFPAFLWLTCDIDSRSSCSFHRTKSNAISSITYSICPNSPNLTAYFYLTLFRETIPLSRGTSSFDLMLLVHQCVTSTGVLSKSVWSTLNDYRSSSMDDLLLKERNYNDAYYYPCPVLDPNKKQPLQQQQQQHQQQQHQLQPQQLFTCALCGREYTWMYSLRRHQLQCGNKEARNKCHFCSRKFYRRDRLKEHLLAHHSDLI